MGTGDAGKSADLVLLDADPLREIGNTEKVWDVVRARRSISPQEVARFRHAAARVHVVATSLRVVSVDENRHILKLRDAVLTYGIEYGIFGVWPSNACER